MTLRVVLADDHAVVREGIRQLLDDEPDIQVVAEADDGAAALHALEAWHPDVLVLDIQMPGMGGAEAAREAHAQHPETAILVLTAYDDDPYVFAMLDAGVTGYVLKSATGRELATAVRAVASGRGALDPDVALKVLDRVRRPAADTKAVGIDPLTTRELEVLRHAARGLTNQAIGRTLGISDRTVQGHLAVSYQKMKVTNRTEAVLRALREGWLSLDEIGDGDWRE